MTYQRLQQTVFAIVIACTLGYFGCKRETDSIPKTTRTLAEPESMADASELGCNSPSSSHNISYATAKQLINNYQDAVKVPGKLCQLYGQGGYVLCETFPASAIRDLLNQNNVCALRIYNGLGADNRQHLVLVGVNSNNYDTLAASQPGVGPAVAGFTAGGFKEIGGACPLICFGCYINP